MFTGLIEEVGSLRGRHPLRQGLTLEISAPQMGPDLAIGDSVAINGVCQTVVRINRDSFFVEAVGDTLTKTTLGQLVLQTPLNLERALAANGRFDGHLVSGHVNGTGLVRRWYPSGEAWFLEIELQPDLLGDTLAEGSLAVDGISLTIAEKLADGVRLSIIPHTRAETNLRTCRPGLRVNLETDLLARLQSRAQPATLTLEKLRDWGY